MMSKLVAQLIGAYIPGICRAESRGFEPRSDLKIFISRFHLALCQLARLLCLLVLGDWQNKVEGVK